MGWLFLIVLTVTIGSSCKSCGCSDTHAIEKACINACAHSREVRACIRECKED